MARSFPLVKNYRMNFSPLKERTEIIGTTQVFEKNQKQADFNVNEFSKRLQKILLQMKKNTLVQRTFLEGAKIAMGHTIGNEKD